jgi:small-conductance mechanosensitive channel
MTLSIFANSLRTALRCLALALLLIGSPSAEAAPTAGVAAAKATAEAASPDAAPTPDQLDALARTLEDPADRAKLVEQLRALVAAQRASKAEQPQPTAVTAVGLFIEKIAERATTLGDSLTEAATTLNDLPHIEAWVQAEISDPARLQRWIKLAWKVPLSLATAYLASLLVTWLLRRPRHAVDARGETLIVRLFLGIARFVLDLAPLVAFVAAGYMILPLLGAARTTSLIAIGVINATVAVRGVLVVSQRIFAPGRDALRIVRLSDETASYIHLWIGRLTALGVYGYVLVKAAILMGVPLAVDGLLMRLVGLAVLAMIVILVLQNRQAASDWLRPDGKPAANRRGLRSVRRRLAAIWHVLVILYACALYAVWALDIEDGFEYLLRSTALTIATVIVTRGLSLLLHRAIDRGFALSAELKLRLPALEARANRYLPVLHTSLRVALYLAAGFVLLQVWGADSFDWLLSDVGRRMTGSAAAVVVVIALAIGLWEIMSSLIERYLSETDANGLPLPRSARTRTLLPLLRNATLVILVTFVTLTLLSQIGIDIAPLLAGAGVVGLAVGFGAQTLVKDVITGLFILFEDTISVGDVIEVDGRTGTVETITIRTIRLRDQSGAVHTVPFSSVSSVKNLTRQFAYYVFKIGVAYDTDVDRAIAALREVDEDMRSSEPYASQILAPLDVQGLDQFGDSALVIQARTKTVPAQQWAVGREFNRRIKMKFDQIGINIPFPHRTVQIVTAEGPQTAEIGEPFQPALPKPAPLP